MSVNENESTAKSASMGVGVDAISNPISGTSFPEAVALSTVTVSNVFSATASASFNQIFVSGKFSTTSASGTMSFLTATSGTIVAGSGTSMSGIIPQGYITVVVSGVIGKIPYFGAV